jgi:hypothetical protein
MYRRNLVKDSFPLSPDCWPVVCFARHPNIFPPEPFSPSQAGCGCKTLRTYKDTNGIQRPHIWHIYLYTHLETLSAFFFAGGKTLLGLRRKLSTDMLKQQNTEKIPTRNYAGIMGNYTAWKHDRLTISKQPANQNLRHGCKNAGKHLKAPFTRQSRLFPERQN